MERSHSDSAVHNKCYSKTMALTLCKETRLPTDKPLNIRDIDRFEDLLDVNILVLSAKLGNKFYHVGRNVTGRKIFTFTSLGNRVVLTV